jgi:hypothetical protein
MGNLSGPAQKITRLCCRQMTKGTRVSLSGGTDSDLTLLAHTVKNYVGFLLYEGAKSVWFSASYQNTIHSGTCVMLLLRNKKNGRPIF